MVYDERGNNIVMSMRRAGRRAPGIRHACGWMEEDGGEMKMMVRRSFPRGSDLATDR